MGAGHDINKTLSASIVSILFSHFSTSFESVKMYLPFTIKSTFGDSKGKFGSYEQSGIIAEYSSFMNFLAKNLDPDLSQVPRVIAVTLLNLFTFYFFERTRRIFSMTLISINTHITSTSIYPLHVFLPTSVQTKT
jgi:hypothetical protein